MFRIVRGTNVVRSPSAIVLDSATLAISVVQGSVGSFSTSTNIRNAPGTKGRLGVPVVSSVTGGAASSISTAVTRVNGVWRVTATCINTGNSPGDLLATINIIDSTNGDGNTIASTVLTLTTTSSSPGPTPVLGLVRIKDDWTDFVVGGAESPTIFVATFNAGGGTLGSLTFENITWSPASPTDWAIFQAVSGGFTVTSDQNPAITVDDQYIGTVDVKEGTGNTTKQYKIISRVGAATPVPEINVVPSTQVVTWIGGVNPAPTTHTVSNVTGPFVDLGTVTPSVPGLETWLTPSLNGQTLTITYSGNLTVSPGVAIVRLTSVSGGSVDVTINGLAQTPSTGYDPPSWTLPTFATHSSVDDDITEALAGKAILGNFPDA